MAGHVDYNLGRFIDAQNGMYDQALQELGGGRKRSHWMWFIFPQVAGLGSSAMAEKYAIRSAEEAAAYLSNPISGRPTSSMRPSDPLGRRYARRTEIFGSPDDLKLRSSLTLFAAVSDQGSLFHEAIDRFYGGKFDERTIEILNAAT